MTDSARFGVPEFVICSIYLQIMPSLRVSSTSLTIDFRYRLGINIISFGVGGGKEGLDTYRKTNANLGVAIGHGGKS